MLSIFFVLSSFSKSLICDEAQTGPVVLNEIHADPAGDDAGREWIELTTPLDRPPVDLTGWTILAGTRSLTSSTEFPPLVLQPGEHLVVGPSPLADLNLALPTLGNAGSNADAVQLRDCTGTVVDTVVYGTPNLDGFLDDSGTPATALAPAPPTGGSLARRPDGFDSDASDADFVAVALPTPGEANDLGFTCMTGDLVVNEALVNPAGADGSQEWIELYNRGHKAVSVADWSIRAHTRSDRFVRTFFPDHLVEPGTFWVLDEGPLHLGNGAGTDGLILEDCRGATIDTVVYGEPGNADGILDDEGWLTEPYADPGTEQVLARWSDGHDTNSADDWAIRSVGSPGSTNQRTASHEPVGGCADAPPPRSAPSPKAPASCTFTRLGGLGWGWLLVWLLRRHR
ncbi:MAG: lamin tail domain-containing protein [Myxococcota bacterium]